MPASATTYTNSILGNNSSVHLREDGIESFHFLCCDSWRISWSDIEKATVGPMNGKVFLRLHLKKTSRLKMSDMEKNGPSLLARPVLNLTPYNNADRERIYKEVTFHIRRAADSKPSTSTAIKAITESASASEFLHDVSSRGPGNLLIPISIILSLGALSLWFF